MANDHYSCEIFCFDIHSNLRDQPRTPPSGDNLGVLDYQLKVEPYSLHGLFLKLEYLKTEFNEDNGTYAIVKVTSHSCRIMVNLSISDYFEVMRHPLKNISGYVSFFGKMSRLTL